MELTSKQRAQLRGLANTIDTIIHIGKDGIGENLVKQTDDALEARELIKGKVLETAPGFAGEIAAQLAEATCAMLDRFRVNYCIESFDPRCILWLKKHRPLIIRGQLSEQFLRHGESGGGHGRLTMWLLGNLLTNVATQPDFIAYRFSDRENLCLRLCHKVYHVQEVNWTIRAKEEMEAAEQAGNLVIFECFDPEV